VNTIRTLIVDDEPPARRGLMVRLARHADIEVVAAVESGREALRAIAEHRPDLVLLDVQMPGLDGFGVLEGLPAADPPLVVFVTAYDRYALRAFQVHAVDYLLKPIESARLDEMLAHVRADLSRHKAGRRCERLLRLLGEVTGRPQLTLAEALVDDAATLHLETHLAIRDGARTLRVALDEVDWIDAAGDYMCVHAGPHTYVLRATMRTLEQRLDPRRFQRVHRSTVVNLARIRELRTHPNGECFLILDGGQRLKLSRSYRDRLALLRQRRHQR
jgi:two-component system LytT family response regulator